MPLHNPITEPQIPQPIARDAEFQAADAAHVNAPDPHGQYRLKSTAITDAELPGTITRDAEFQAADAAHVNAPDPHPQYLLPSEGDARYLGINAKAIDAENVDGIDSSRIVFGENWHKAMGASVNIDSVFYTSGFLDCYGGGGTFPFGTEHINGFQSRHGNPTNQWGMQAGCQNTINNEFYFRTVTYGVWHPWRRVWNDGNFNPASHVQVFSPTVKAFGDSEGLFTAIANNCGFEVRSANTSSAAFISFHRPGIYGVHFGIDTNNELRIGGWSMAGASYRIFHEGVPLYFGSALPIANTAGNSIAFGWNSVQPGQGIAEICNYAGLGGGDAFNFFRMGGNAVAFPTLSHRVARIDITGAYIQTSDRRLKQNFSPSPGLAEILALSPQKYRHYECEEFEEKTKKIKLGKNSLSKIGFVAQDVRKVLPEAVDVTQSEGELYGIDYSCIVACLVRAVQEQQQQISELRARLPAVK
ncbi:tail fiber domain-containing protein [Microcoleus sp. Pol8_D6]|uniref:tail fiber domain-containing protein n=1 Tax=Microcoleus sp. Pol8_D6 TaxID=2818899 RepID=UPI002FD61FD0